MTDLNSTPIQRKDSIDIRKQVSIDLKKKLSEYHDPKKGLKAMSALMSVHEKTLKRLIECENKANYQTLLKIYRALYQTNSDSEVVELAPEAVSQYIKKSRLVRDEFTDKNITVDVDIELQRNPIFCEIYVHAATGGISKEYISYNYGKYGERVLNEMIDLEVIVPLNKYKYILGRNQASFEPKTIKSVSLHLAERFSNPSKSDTPGENYQGFLAAGLNEDTYQKWLEIDQNAYLAKAKLSQDTNNQGDIRVFAYCCVDTLIEKEQEKYH